MVNYYERQAKIYTAKIAQHITLSINIPKDLTILADEGELNEIFYNLIVNSVRAINKRQTDGGAIIKVTAMGGDGKIVMKVVDNGIGIDTEDIRKLAIKKSNLSKPKIEAMKKEELLRLIFEDWFTTRKGGGQGMGIISRIIRKYNGTINVQSEPGKGTTVIVEFPQDLQAIRERIIWMYENGLEDAADEIARALDLDTNTLKEIMRLTKEMRYYQKHKLKSLILKARGGSGQNRLSHIFSTSLNGLLDCLCFIAEKEADHKAEFMEIIEVSVFLMEEHNGIVNVWRNVKIGNIDIEKALEKYKDLYLELKDNKAFHQVFTNTLQEYYIYLENIRPGLEKNLKYLKFRAGAIYGPVDIESLDNTNTAQKSI